MANYFVDPFWGDDNNDGLTFQGAFESFQAGVSAADAGDYVWYRRHHPGDVSKQVDYPVFTKDLEVRFNSGNINDFINFVGWPRPSLTLNSRWISGSPYVRDVTTNNDITLSAGLRQIGARMVRAPNDNTYVIVEVPASGGMFKIDRSYDGADTASTTCTVSADDYYDLAQSLPDTSGAPYAPSAYYDYTDFTEEDPGADITVNDNRIDFNIPNNVSSWVVYDEGVDAIDKDWEFEFVVDLTSSTKDGAVLLWAISNTLGDWEDLEAAQDGIGFYVYRTASSFEFRLRDFSDGSEDTWDSGQSSGRWSVKTFGNNYDPDSWVDADITQILPFAAQDILFTRQPVGSKYRYVYGFASKGDAETDTTVGFVRNLVYWDKTISGGQPDASLTGWNRDNQSLPYVTASNSDIYFANDKKRFTFKNFYFNGITFYATTPTVVNFENIIFDKPTGSCVVFDQSEVFLDKCILNAPINAFSNSGGGNFYIKNTSIWGDEPIYVNELAGYGSTYGTLENVNLGVEGPYGGDGFNADGPALIYGKDVKIKSGFTNYINVDTYINIENLQKIKDSHVKYGNLAEITKIKPDGTGDFPNARSGGSDYILEVVESRIVSGGLEKYSPVPVFEQTFISDENKTYRYYVQSVRALTSDRIYLEVEYINTYGSVNNFNNLKVKSTQNVAVRSGQSDWTQYIEVANILPATPSKVVIKCYCNYELVGGDKVYIDPLPEISDV